MKPMYAVGLTLAAMLTACGAVARTYTALELSIPPATAAPQSTMDNDSPITRDVRRRLADCLRAPGERAACVALSADHCPQDIQIYVCANSEYIVWMDYIGYYLSVLRAVRRTSYTTFLEQSQGTWQAYAAAQCDYIGHFWRDIESRLRSMSVAECKRDEAGRRALGLRADILNLETDK